jgi:hypothetical protein
MSEYDELEGDVTEDEVDEGTITVNCFFHTGGQRQVNVPYYSSVSALRDTLREDGIRADGQSVLVNGMAVASDAEECTDLNPGDMVFFTGSVKGG